MSIKRYLGLDAHKNPTVVAMAFAGGSNPPSIQERSAPRESGGEM